MRLIDADKLCEDLLERWSIADTRKEELIRQVMADIVTPIIAGQSTIEPMRWISCSERMPSEYGMYLVTMTEKAKAEELGFDVDEIDVRKMRYNSNGWQLPRHIPSWINNAVKDDVLAWMPLPEPWRGDKDEN